MDIKKTYRVYQAKTYLRVIDVEASSLEMIAEMIRAKGDALDGDVKDEYFTGPTRWDIEDVENNRVIAMQDMWKDTQYVTSSLTWDTSNES